jgi:glutathione S-transferase
MDSSGFLCNGKLSIADLILYTTCSWIGMGALDGISADFIKANEKVAAHYKMISEIPEVAKWNSEKRAGKVPAF